MNIHDIMKISGYSKEQLNARFGIPIVTLKSWIYGYRNPPEWVLTMFAYIITLERSLDHVKVSAEGLASDMERNSEGSQEACKASQSENGTTGEICSGT